MASPTPGNAARFAKRFGIAKALTDYRELLELPEIEMVVVGPGESDLYVEKIYATDRHGNPRGMVEVIL